MAPDSGFLRSLLKGSRYANRVVSIRARREQVIRPKSSSILDGAKNIEVDVIGHNSLMRSEEVIDIIKKELK